MKEKIFSRCISKDQGLTVNLFGKARMLVSALHTMLGIKNGC